MSVEAKYQYQLRHLSNHLHPRWYSPRYQTRTRLRQELQRIIDNDLAGGEKILDFGCGDKPYEPLFKSRFEQYLGADLPGNPDAEITIDPQGQLQIEDESVDAVLSVQVLEHVENPPAYLAQARRVLKPDGSLILSTHGTWPYHPDPSDFWRWTIEGLNLEISRAGFEVLSCKGILGRAATGLQWWQDATAGLWPRYVCQMHNAFFQGCIGLIEKIRGDKTSDDNCIFVIHARKVS